MKDASDSRMPPASDPFHPRATSEYRSMETDGWDLQVTKTYAGIGGDGCMDRPSPAGRDASASSVPASPCRLPEPTLLDRVRNEVRKKHYSGRTEDAYADWVGRYLRFHRFLDPLEMGKKEVEQFLSHLAVERERHDSLARHARPGRSESPSCR